MRIAPAALLLGALSLPSAAAAQLAEKPEAPPARQTTPAPRPAARAPAASAVRPSLTVFVTDREGRALPGIGVRASGPVEREATTDAEGGVLFRNMSAGTYRLRFEGKEFTTLEQDVTVGTRGVKSNASLTPAPPPPPPPPPPEAKAPPTPPPPTSLPPMSSSIPDVFEKTPSTRQPVVGCTGSATATLIQMRDPIADRTHDDADEMLYVVAGEGSAKLKDKDIALSAGVLASLPRGTTYSLTRRGSRPLVLVSILTGPPCTGQ